MSQESVQQPIGEPTTPTPYPDGLVLHQVDGPTIYPEAYTGVRPAEVPDAWYHPLGFHYVSGDGYYGGYWMWYGPEWFQWEVAGLVLAFLAIVFIFGGASLALIYKVRPDLLRPSAALFAWSGVLLIALALVTIAEYQGDAEYTLAMLPIAGLILFLARPARSLLRGLVRYSLLTALFVFPDLIFFVLEPDYEWGHFELFATVAWVALAPLALWVEADKVTPSETKLRQRFLIAAGLFSLAHWFQTTNAPLEAMSFVHIGVAALGLAACTALLCKRVPPQRGSLVT